MSRPGGQSPSPGLTLVETIFSTLFVSMAILAIVNLFPGAYLSIKRSETQLQADMLAKSVIDEVRNMRFDALVPGDFALAVPPFEPQVIEGVLYTPKTTISTVPDTNPAFLKHVRVDVSYRVGRSAQTVTHETYIHGAFR